MMRSVLSISRLAQRSPALYTQQFFKSAVATQVPVPWGRQPDPATFHPDFPTEFRPSTIDGAGKGWYAKTDIPAGVCMRRVSPEDGSLIRIGSEEELKETGWDVDDAVNYGIGHHKDKAAIYFLSPGTAVNHADRTRDPSVEYKHLEDGSMEIWTVKDVKKGEEMFCDYVNDYGPCEWYDELQNERGNIPLSQLPAAIEKMYE